MLGIIGQHTQRKPAAEAQANALPAYACGCGLANDCYSRKFARFGLQPCASWEKSKLLAQPSLFCASSIRYIPEVLMQKNHCHKAEIVISSPSAAEPRSLYTKRRYISKRKFNI